MKDQKKKLDIRDSSSSRPLPCLFNLRKAGIGILPKQEGYRLPLWLNQFLERFIVAEWFKIHLVMQIGAIA